MLHICGGQCVELSRLIGSRPNSGTVEKRPGGWSRRTRERGATAAGANICEGPQARRAAVRCAAMAIVLASWASRAWRFRAGFAVLVAIVCWTLALPALAQASIPSASTFNAFSTSATTAMVEGSVNPAGESTQYHVAYDLASSEWCTSHGAKGSPTHSTSPLTLGPTAPGFHAVSVGLSGLTGGSEYCEELIAANGSGTSAGFQQFFTAGTPSVRTFGPRATTSTNELVEGEVNPVGQSTQYHVAYDLAGSEWCTSHGSKGSPGHSTSLVTLGFTAPKFRRVSVGLSGLTGGSEYCEELIAANGSGTSSGFTQTFTAGTPSVNAFGSRAIASTAELVNGQVNPAGQSTQYHVAYDLASSEWCTSNGSKGSPTHATSPLTLGATAAKFHPVSVGLSGLTGGSAYCEELIAVNGSGTSAAFPQSFTAGTPSVNAFGARAIASTNELVEGEVNPAGQSTQYHVAYDLASSEWCTSGGSKGSPGHATSLVTLGSTAPKFRRVSVGLSGLTGGSEYCEELIADNASGASVGFQQSFTAGAPSAFAFSPQSTGTTTATVGGEVNPSGQSTQYHVAYDLAISEWCTSRGLASSPAHSTAPVTLGFTDATSHQVSVELTGLTAGSEYCEELIAANASGTSAGFQQSFTAGAPSAFTFGPQSTGATTATVGGEVNPSGQTTQYHVAYDLASSEWCTSSGLAGSPAHSTTPVTLGFTDATFHQVSVELTALTGGSEYCFELIAVNGSGTSEGFPQSFTAGAPSAFAFAPQPTGATTATVAGQVNPSGQTTKYHVAYDLASSEWCTSSGLAGSPAHSTTPVTLGFTDATSHQVSVELTGLSAGNEYCAELIAVNGSGTGHGSAEFFFSGLPAASTSNAFATGATTAMVGGQVNPSGQTTQYHVAYDLAGSEWCTSSGLAGSPAHSTTPVTLGFTDATSHQVSVELTGLSAGNEYCVELIAANGSGTAHGSQVTFFAGFPAASTSNAFATGATTATVEGQVNPSGQTTQYHVAYDLASSEWCASEGLAGSPAHSTTPATLGFTDAGFHQVSVELTGLSASNAYCVELLAVNGSGTAHSSQLRFTAAPPMPAVTKVSPASGTTAGGTLVTIIGTALEGATAVHFGAASATIKTNTATEITAESPAHAGGQVDVTVTTPGGTSATSEVDHYSYVGVPEEITPPKISGTAQQGKTLTEEHGTWTNQPILSYKLQWLRCTSSGTECTEKIGGATEPTYVPVEADVGHKLKVEEKAINKTGESKPAISAATAEVLPHEPVDETPPMIKGTPQQGQTLPEEHGTWKYTPTSYKLQWLRCNSLGEGCLPIEGATSQTYTPTKADVGEKLKVEETAVNAGGAGTPALSVATAVVTPAVPEEIAPPKISGVAKEGQTLAVENGGWTNEPKQFEHRWLRCNESGGECSAISTATGETYVVVTSDVGHTIRVEEVAINAGGPSKPAESAATLVVLPLPPVNIAPPTVTGTAQEGKTLTAHAGTWEHTPTKTKLQWVQCDGAGMGCSTITGAQGETYTPTLQDVSHTIRVEETAENAGGPSLPAPSAAIAVVTIAVPVNLTAPKIAGSAEKGQTLVESHGTWTNEPTTYTYKWERCNGAGEECALITGALNETYQPNTADVGHTLRVQETAVNAGGESPAAPSVPTTVVVPIPLHAAAGENLTATVGAPVVFDGSGSSPASEIEHYNWEFGDGSTNTEKSPVHTYAAAGSYAATLTVSRGTETAHQSISVTVSAPAAHNVKIKTVDHEGHPIAGATVLYVGSGGTRVQATTGAEGEAALEGLPDGTDTVYAYESGYRPLVGNVAVTGGAGTTTLTLVSGEVATSTLKSHELNLKEIEAAGINVNDPANQHVYEFEVRLAFIEGTPPATLHGYINNSGVFVGPSGGGVGGGGGGWTCSPNECEGGGIVVVPALVDGHPLIQWLILRGKATVLKQFFEVSMVIQNLSPEPFKLTAGSAALHLPPGISFAPTSTPQQETQTVEDVPGLGSKTVNWIIRGDTPGSYYLSADYHGKLNIIEAPVDLHAELAQPLKVWGVEALSLKVYADEGALHAGVPYNVRIGVRNEANVPLYNVAVTIDENTHEHFIFQPDQKFTVTFAELAPGDTFGGTYVLVPDGASESTFKPALSSATFAGEAITPGADIEQMSPPPLYALTATNQASTSVHIHWEQDPNAEGYEVFSTPTLDTPFPVSPEAVLASPSSTQTITRLPAGSTDAYISGAAAESQAYYTVSSIINGKHVLDHPVVQAGLTGVHVPSDVKLLDGIACTGERSCVAVGNSPTGEGVVVGVSNGLPSKAMSVPGSTHLYAVACETSASCFAVGNTSTAKGIVVPIVNGSPGKARVVSSVIALEGVACHNAGACLAVGTGEGAGGGAAQGIAVPITNGVVGGAYDLSGNGHKQVSDLHGVTCRNTCLAVGNNHVPEGVVVDIQPATLSHAVYTIGETESLSAVDCFNSVSCHATGTTKTPGSTIIVPVTDGIPPTTVFRKTPPKPEYIIPPVSGYLKGISCVAEATCLAVGENASFNQGVFAVTAGSHEAVPAASQLFAISCHAHASCWAVGETSAGTAGLIQEISQTADPNVNYENHSCSSSNGGGGFDAVIDEFPEQHPNTFTGVRAFLGPASLCRSPGYPTSSWVMLQNESPYVFVQAGVFYNSDGTDNPFVEVRGTNLNAPKSENDGLIEYQQVQFQNSPPEPGSIEIFALGQVPSSSVRFAVESKGIRPKGYDKACPWVVKQGKKAEYEQYQGYTRRKRRLEVEARMGGHCLWIYYLPANTSFGDADLAGAETHREDDAAPGTYEKPLTFRAPRVQYGGSGQSFAPTGLGTLSNPRAPLPNYNANFSVGCESYVPYWGSQYKFSTWGKNEYGTCAPWAVP